MAKVICTLKTASELINGVKFVTHRDGMISEEISDDVAANFASIPGYVLADAEQPSGKKQVGAKDSAKADGATPPADPAAAGADAGKK